MICRQLHIDGFGRFSDYTIQDLQKGVNIISGYNEAGKSTLLAFLRYTLFGHPSGKTKKNKYEPLYGGRHGGRITALMQSGEEVVFERYAGSKGGAVKLLVNDSEIYDTTLWYEYLGKATADLYQNVYTFSLDELVSIDSLDQSNVRDRIFNIGLGLGENTSLQAIDDELIQHCNRFYKKGGKAEKYEIPSIANSIEALKQQKQEIQNHLPLFQSLNKEVQELESAAHELQKKQTDISRQKNTLQAYLNCYEDYITLIEAISESAHYTDLPSFPENGIAQLDKSEEKEQELINAIREIEYGSGDEEGMQALKERLAAIEINQGLLQVADKLDFLEKNFEKYKTCISNKEENLRNIYDYEQAIAQHIQQINPVWTHEDILNFTGLEVLEDQLQQFRDEDTGLDDKIRNLNADMEAFEKNQTGLDIKKAGSFAAAIFFIIAIPFFWEGLYVFGITALLIAVLVFFGRNYVRKQSLHEDLKIQRDAYLQKQEQLHTAFYTFCENKLQIAQQLTYDTAQKIINTVKQLQQQINAYRRIKQKHEEETMPFLKTFEDQVNAVKYKINETHHAHDFEQDVIRLIETGRKEREKAEDKQRLQEQLRQKQNLLEKNQVQLKSVREQISELLRLANAENRETFRKMALEQEKVQDLRDAQKEARKNIAKIAGHDKVDEVIDYLQGHEKSSIEEKLRELEAQLAQIEEAYKLKYKTWGEKDHELNQIRGTSALNEVLTHLESERERLNDARKQWLSGKIAHKILNDVKEEYEKQKQPEVIKNANSYFCRMTDGKYKGIRASFEEKEVKVFDDKGDSKHIEQLSRGTREQLLISLRLGFIEAYEQKFEPLPLIADEVLVNFDPVRAKNTARCLQEFAHNRQVLFFTCHEHIPALFDKASNHIILRS